MNRGETEDTRAKVAIETHVHGRFVRHSFVPLDPPDGGQVSVYRIGDTLVDTGSRRVTDAVLATLRDDPPRRVLLTHQHEDHVGNVRAIRDAFGAIPVHAPRALVDVIVALRTLPRYRDVVFGPPHPIERDDLVPYDPGDVFEAGGLALVATHTPGHTPPHIAFVADDGDATYVLSGDLYASKPLAAFYESAADDTIASYRALARHGERLRMLPTHGRVRDHAAVVLDEAADYLARESDAVRALAEELATRDPIRLAEARYGVDRLRKPTAGEIGTSVFVRSILDPVRALPAKALAL